MRHVEITHIYVLSIDEDDIEVLDPVVNSGVSMVEASLKTIVGNAIDLHSDWKLMPREYSRGVLADEERIRGRAPKRYDQDPNMTQAEKDRDSELSKMMIEADADAGINFAGDVMGQNTAGATHPWSQGLSIFPEDHPLRPFEDQLREQDEEEALRAMQALAPKLKELPSGDDDEQTAT